MKRKLLVAVFAVLSATAAFAQSKSFWAPVSHERAQSLGEVKETFIGITDNLFQLDAEQLKQVLAAAPQRSAGAVGIIVAIPNADGKMEHYRVFESSNFAPELQAQFPDIRAYAGYGVEDPTASLRMSVSPQNIQTMVLRGDRETEFIEPFNRNATVYSVFSSGVRRAKGQVPFTCFQEDVNLPVNTTDDSMSRNMSSDQTFRTFRLALS